MAALHPDLTKAIDFLNKLGVSGDPQDPVVRTRTRLLDAATKLFQTRGYQHTSVDEIAREAGVAKGTVYVHFKNKQELLLHAIAEEKKALLQSFIPILTADVPPSERLERYLEAGLLSLQRAPLLSKLMLGDRQILLQLDELGDELREQLQDMQIKATVSLARGVGAFDQLSPRERNQRARVLIATLVSATALLEENARFGVSLDVFAKQLAKIIVSGIGAR